MKAMIPIVNRIFIGTFLLEQFLGVIGCRFLRLRYAVVVH